jgi:formylglycine-generating enzyme required for sulfatase activity/serine/threonine protein kinase
MPVALETFLSQLSESGLLSDQKLRAATHKKAEHQDGESLARDMIKSGYLTKYQAEQILSGKGKSLYMGQYVLLEKLGSGGMGQVLKAYHPGMDRIVAIKVILAKGKISEESVRRFEREVKAAAKLSHPNIITVYDAGNDNGRHFMVMELVKGRDLNMIVHRKGTLGVGETINYIKQVARGLAFAHENGVIHRDIKPANLLLDTNGNVKILDMGLAKIDTTSNKEKVSMLTGTTSIMGTVDFMSPEQGLSSRNVDARTDMYSLGATLYYLLTKQVMYSGETAFAKLIAHSELPIPSLKTIRPDVPENLDLIFMKMVAKQVEDRFQSMLELVQELEVIEKESTSTDNLVKLSTANLLLEEFGEMGVNRLSSKTDSPSSKFTKFFKEKDYKIALISTGAVILVSGIVAFAFFALGRTSNQQKEVALNSVIEKENLAFLNNKGSFENVKSIAPIKENSGKATPPVKVLITPAIPKLDALKVMPTTINLLEAPFTKIKANEKQNEVANILRKEVEEKVDLGNGVSLDLVLIPPGKFVMGSPPTEIGHHISETQHEVTLTKPFFIGKYEVTQEQWETISGNNPSETKGPNLPVTSVSWDDCQTFIKKLNEKTKGSYRLPTEAEWEFSCRAGTTIAYSFGSSIKKNDANFGDGMAGVIKPVGSYKANPYGLYDMHGNVYEWCEDWFAPYAAGLVTNPKGPAAAELRVLRGGSFGSNDENSLRCANRFFNAPSNRFTGVGFRLVRDIAFDTEVVPAKIKPDPATVVPTNEVLLVAPFSETKAKEVQKEIANSLKKEVEEKVNLGNGVSLDLVLIPAGKFVMGSPTTEIGRNNDETQHEVTLTKPFYIGKYEVTQEQWEAVMGDNPSQVKGVKLPVELVSWNDCQEFIKKLNVKSNERYRLPTEAEWEYACRAGTTTAYSLGENITPKDANYAGSKIGKPVAVGSYKPNAFGLFDMCGNVREWCEDWYGAYPAGSIINQKGPAKGERWVLRGGCFVNDETYERSSARNYYNPPDKRGTVVGFRLARTIDFKVTVAPTAPKQSPLEFMPSAGNLLDGSFSEIKAKEVQKEIAMRLQKEVEEKVNLGNEVSLDLVLIPPGKFVMGSPPTEIGHHISETQHEVTLTKPFYMGKYEVTQEQWEKVMGNNPSQVKGEKLPVTNASWENCQEFIKRLNANTSGGYRLPTEAEWEYACRAGTTTAYSFGDRLTKAIANYAAGPRGRTKVVGSYKPNSFGLHDMHGNVWEWCEDWRGAYPMEAVIDPKGPATGERRILRGGSCDGVSDCRSSGRINFGSPAYRIEFNGFRLARTIDFKVTVVPPAPKPFPTKLKEEVETKVASIEKEMVLIPAGKFMMGSHTSEKGRRNNEKQHEVTITNPYYMGKYEITQEQWEAVMGDNPSQVKGAKLPVTDVWGDYCQEFIKKLNANTSGGYRLPTEAEWEYACRAGTRTAYSFGDKITPKDANYTDSRLGKSVVVGSYEPNAFGLYDMHGNVREWCEDWFGPYPTGSVMDPKGPVTGERWALRGGCFVNDETQVRSSARNYYKLYEEKLNGPVVGFRLARTVDNKTVVASAVPNTDPRMVTPVLGN